MLRTLSLASPLQHECISLLPQALCLIWWINELLRPGRCLSSKYVRNAVAGFFHVFPLAIKCMSYPTLLLLWKLSNKLAMPIIDINKQKREKEEESLLYELISRYLSLEQVTYFKPQLHSSRPNRKCKIICCLLWLFKTNSLYLQLYQDVLLPERIHSTEFFANKESSSHKYCLWHTAY